MINIEKIKINHPSFKRKIYVLFINNKLDTVSFDFLVYMARYGGHNGGIVGRTSHKGIVEKIGELYFHLDNVFNIKLEEATEYHIRIIRDRMVGLEKERLIDSVTMKEKEIVSYSTADDKLRVWFKFYRYVQKKYKCDINLTYKYTRKIFYDSMLKHINSRQIDNDDNVLKIWALLFNKKKRINRKKALSLNEFNILISKLEEIDLVYAMMALYAVKTALRIGALMEIKESDFDDYFRIISSQTTSVQRIYTAKYDKKLTYNLSVELLKIIKSRYLTREFPERQEAHYNYCKDKPEQKYNSDTFWIRADGKEIKENDFRDVLSKVSEILGKRNHNKITPHTFRHTAATWKVLEIAEVKNINLKNTGYYPPPIIKLAIAELLGHCSDATILIYIATAIELFETGNNDGIIRMPKREFILNIKAKELLIEKARKELGDEIVKNDNFDIIKYGIEIGQIIE